MVDGIDEASTRKRKWTPALDTTRGVSARLWSPVSDSDAAETVSWGSSEIVGNIEGGKYTPDNEY